MKKFLVLLSIIATGLSFCAFGSPQVKTDYKFAADSPLKSGKWVRISVNSTGIYEITYDELREMGFSDPSKVSVFGASSYQLPINFLTVKGERNFEDNPRQTGVLHTNDKLIFYAYGTSNMVASNVGYQATNRVRLRRDSKSIYSEKAYYLLTDSDTPLEIAKHKVEDKSSAVDVEFGYANIYHELDKTQGQNGTGQLFFGEKLVPGLPLTFDVSGKYCADKPAYLYTQFAIQSGQNGNVYTYINEGSSSLSTAQTSSGLSTLPNDHELSKFKIDENHQGTATLKFLLSEEFSPYAICAIDYWSLTYPVNLDFAKDDPDFSSQYLAFNSGIAPVWRHPLPDGAVAWDITAGKTPEAFDTADGWFYNDKSIVTEAIVFNPDNDLPKVNPDRIPLQNQNLHALATEPIDFVIFAPGQLLPYAQRMAEAHEKYQGIRAIALDPQTVFDEFNSGTPDPTALRMFIKLLYHNEDHPVQNVLFLGPLYADYRNVTDMARTLEGHIAYEQPVTDFTTQGLMAMDIYGMITDYYAVSNNIRNAPISIGVGILPVSSLDEAENCVNKTLEQLRKEDLSEVINENMVISCPGNELLHTLQAASLAQMIRDIQKTYYKSDPAERHVWIEKYGTDHSDFMIKDAWNKGKNLTTYYGHAAASEFNCINLNDMLSLKNKDLGFLYLAACDLCEPDMQRHGVGDLGVIRSKRGFFGTMCSTRPVIASENDELCRNFTNALYINRDGMLREQSPTMGDAYALSKDRTVTDGEASYVLVGDPALEIPVALGRVDMTLDRNDYRPGDIITVSGCVKDFRNKLIDNYNGYVTIKLMEPEVNMYYDASFPPVRNTDCRIVTVKGKVTDGLFTVKIPLDNRVDAYMSRNEDNISQLPLLAGTYDPSMRLGASGVSKIAMALAGTSPENPEEAEKDETAPALSLKYDQSAMMIRVAVSDDTALRPGIGNGGGISLTIDDKSYSELSGESEETLVSSTNYNISAARLGIGNHIVRGTATDANGNSSEEQILEFTITDPCVNISLKALASYGIDEIGFEIEGTTDEELILFVQDKNGNTLLRETIDGSRIILDISELPAGRYTAYVRPDSPAAAYIHSNRVEFTAID